MPMHVSLNSNQTAVSNVVQLYIEGCYTTGVSNVRPASQKRPVAWLNPACGMIL